jgi:hypothetical protein
VVEAEVEAPFSDIRALKHASEAPPFETDEAHSPLERVQVLLRAGELCDGMTALMDALRGGVSWPPPAQYAAETLRTLATALPLLDRSTPSGFSAPEQADALCDAALALHADTTGLVAYVSALQLLAAVQLGDPARVVRSAAVACALEHVVPAPWTTGFHVILRTTLAQHLTRASSMHLQRVFSQAVRAHWLDDSAALAQSLADPGSTLVPGPGPTPLMQVLLMAVACDHHARQGDLYAHARLAHLLAQAASDCPNRHAAAIACIVDQRDIYAGSLGTRKASLGLCAAGLEADDPHTGLWIARCEVERAKAERISGDASAAFRRMALLSRSARQLAAWSAAHFKTLVLAELAASALAAAAETADKGSLLQCASEAIAAIPGRLALALAAGCAWQKGLHAEALRHLHALGSSAGSPQAFWPTYAARIVLGPLRGSVSDLQSADAAARTLRASGVTTPTLAARLWLPGIPGE